MKKIFSLFAAAFVALSMIASPTVIIDQPDGVEVACVRIGGKAFQYDDLEMDVSLVDAFGVVTVVFGVDNTVYMKDPIFDEEHNTWIAGTTNADSTKLIFPMGQYIYYNDDYESGYQIYAGLLNSENGFYDHDTTVTEFSYTIDKATGTMSLDDFVDENSILAVFDSFYDIWIPCGEFLSTFEVSDIPSTDLIVPPVGLQTETWCVNGQGKFRDDPWMDLDEFTVQLGFDGSDVYLQGISVDFPNAWIKGTVDAGGTITFDNNVYVGKIYGYDVFVVGYDNMFEVKTALVFTYDAATQSYSSENGIVINKGPFLLCAWERMAELVFSKPTPTALKNVDAAAKVTKAIKNGQLVIEKNGVKFNAQGAKL